MHCAPFLLTMQIIFASVSYRRVVADLRDYFSKGKIVLSTISYPEIKGANYILSEYNEAAITKSIQDIINMDINELLKYSDNISFLRMNFTVQAWKETIHAVDSLNI